MLHWPPLCLCRSVICMSNCKKSVRLSLLLERPLWNSEKGWTWDLCKHCTLYSDLNCKQTRCTGQSRMTSSSDTRKPWLHPEQWNTCQPGTSSMKQILMHPPRLSTSLLDTVRRSWNCWRLIPSSMCQKCSLGICWTWWCLSLSGMFQMSRVHS